MLERPGLSVRCCLLILLINLILPTIGYTNEQRDIEWLAYNVYHESRGEPDVGKILVAIVTINRVDSKHFPNTIPEVVMQPGQFSWYWDGKPDEPTEPIAYKTCMFWSKVVYNLWKSNRLQNITKRLNIDGVKWYHNNSVIPEWKDNYKLVAQLNNHIFYKEF